MGARVTRSQHRAQMARDRDRRASRACDRSAPFDSAPTQRGASPPLESPQSALHALSYTARLKRPKGRCLCLRRRAALDELSRSESSPPSRWQTDPRRACRFGNSGCRPAAPSRRGQGATPLGTPRAALRAAVYVRCCYLALASRVRVCGALRERTALTYRASRRRYAPPIDRSRMDRTSV